jgi:hypothetical protein
MSGTKRVPLARRPAMQVTAHAVDLFVAMGKLRCTCPPPEPWPSPWRPPCAGCARWEDLHDELHRELRCELWEWPCVARQSPRRAGSPTWNDDIAARMRMLREAARTRKAPEPERAD